MTQSKIIRQALVDNAREFHPNERRDGVVLLATVDGKTYRARTSGKVWRIPAIETSLHCTAVTAFAGPVAATLEPAECSMEFGNYCDCGRNCEAAR
jgi:hypothetical protein